MSESPESLMLRNRYRPMSVRDQLVRRALWTFVTLIGVLTILFLLWYSLPIIARLISVVGPPRMSLLDPRGI